jgi:quercetin dioxygenase-like cupin family protein
MQTETFRLGIAFAVAALAVTAASLTVHWTARAQPAEDDNPRFTGVSTALDTDGLRISRRRFEPGARTAWHRHTDGQLLFIEEGRARTGKRGAAMRELGVGESDYTGANVLHWHGAVPDTHMAQVALGFSETTDWFEKVTDDEYNGR